jgi:TRAP-type C4-dicarboxylate transport system substrate-binding protein
MIPDIVVISQKTWDEMSDAQKDVIKTTAKDMSANYKEAWKEFENQVIDDAKNNKGVEFVEDVDIPAFQKAVQPIYDKLKSDEPDTYALVEKIQAAQK